MMTTSPPMVVLAAALLVACSGAKQGSGKADSGTTADWDGASLQEVPIDTCPSVIDTDAAVDAAEEARYIEPVYVGVEFDGVVELDGTISGYSYGGYYYDPLLIFVFASEDYFLPNSEELETREYCLAWADFSELPSFEALETYDGIRPWLSYKTRITIRGHDCDGLVDPALWGADAEELIATFDGARIGLGFGPLTADQTSAWSTPVLDAYGDSMTSTYVSMNWSDGTSTATDLATSFSWRWNWRTTEIVLDDYGYLISEPTDPLIGIPESYVYSVATYYIPFDSLDLDDLGGAR